VIFVVVVLSSSDIRQLLFDQIRQLDSRLDSHVSMLTELQDFYKRRAEVEAEYSRGLDKMVRHIMTRHKAEKQKYVMTHILYVKMAGVLNKVCGKVLCFKQKYLTKYYWI